MTGALSTSTTPADGDFADEWQQWHTIRERDLAAPLGWLSINRLEWLDTEPSRFEGLPGTWWFDGPTAHLRPGDGESFDARDFDLEPTGPGEVVDIDDVHIEVARRGDGYLIRVHDENAPTVRNFRAFRRMTPIPRGSSKRGSSHTNSRGRSPSAQSRRAWPTCTFPPVTWSLTTTGSNVDSSPSTASRAG